MVKTSVDNAVPPLADWPDPNAARPPYAAHPAITLILLVTGTLMAVMLFTYVPYTYVTWSSEVGRLSKAAGVFLAATAVLVGSRWIVIFLLSFTTYWKRRHETPPVPDRWPFVSVFVPAYNESDTIDRAIESLAAMDYPAFEVIVVDDGSADDTFERASRHAGTYPRCTVRVYRKPNGGKWSAHNYAFHRSHGELILCVDADSHLEQDALRRMVQRAADPGVSAVAGHVRVRNRDRTLTRLQALEYLIGNGALRMSQTRFGSVLVVAGPIGLFRRSVLEEVYLRWGHNHVLVGEGQVPGPFEEDTFAEDFDLSLAILTLGGRIVYEPDATAHTKAPDRPFTLLSQRYRWYRGSLQVLRKFFGRLLAREAPLRPRVVAWALFTYVSELVFLCLLYVPMLIALVLILLAGGSALPVLTIFAAITVMNLNAATLFICMHRDQFSVLRVLPVYDFFYGLLLSCAWVMSLFDQVRHARMRW